MTGINVPMASLSMQSVISWSNIPSGQIHATHFTRGANGEQSGFEDSSLLVLSFTGIWLPDTESEHSSYGTSSAFAIVD